MWLQFQRAPRLQDHRAADAAFVDARFRCLVQFRAAQQVRGQQRVVERARRVAVGLGGGDVVAVQFGQHQFRGQAAHTDVLAFAAVAADDHAGHALQRIGHVLVGELAHVLGGDHIDHGVGVALVLQTFFRSRSGSRSPSPRPDPWPATRPGPRAPACRRPAGRRRRWKPRSRTRRWRYRRTACCGCVRMACSSFRSCSLNRDRLRRMSVAPTIEQQRRAK